CATSTVSRYRWGDSGLQRSGSSPSRRGRKAPDVSLSDRELSELTRPEVGAIGLVHDRGIHRRPDERGRVRHLHLDPHAAGVGEGEDLQRVLGYGLGRDERQQRAEQKLPPPAPTLSFPGLPESGDRHHANVHHEAPLNTPGSAASAYPHWRRSPPGGSGRGY